MTTTRGGHSLSRLLPPKFGAGCFGLTLSVRPDIFSTMKPRLITLLFSGLLACAVRNGPAPGDRQLTHVVLDVIRLHHQYAEHPDSLALKRKAALEGFDFTEKDLERLTETWKTDPEALEVLTRDIMETLESDSVYVSWRKTLRRNTVGRHRANKKK